MPEFTKGQPSKRTQVDPRDTFSWTTPQLKVVSRPTDPFVKPADTTRDPNLDSFLQSLKNIEGITNGYVQVQRAYKDENGQKGKGDAAIGKPPETEHEGLFNSGYGYNEAYNVTHGEAKGLEFRKEYLTKLQENNYFQGSPDPQKAHDKFFQDLYTHHFSTVGSNPQLMFGASEQLKQAQVEGSMAFQKASYDTSKTSFTNSVSQMQQDHLYLYAKGAQSEEDLGTLRRILTDDWSLKVKPTNFMTRDQYSQTIVNNIGAVALKMAQDPSMTTSAALAAARKVSSLFDSPDPDTKQSWSSMVDGEGKLKFRADIDHFTSRMNAVQEHREHTDAKWLTEKQDAEEKDLFVKVVLDPNMSLQQKQALITSSKYMKSNQIEDLVGKAEVFHKEEKNIVQDYKSITALRERVEFATSEDTLRSLRKNVTAAYGLTMNSATAKDLDERITSRIDHIKSEARANKTLTLEERKLGWDMLKGVIGEKSMTDLDGTQAALRMDTYGRMFFGRLNSGKESPMEVSKDLISHYATSTGRTAADTLGPSKYTSADAVMADVKAGKLRADEGVLEMRKFLTTKKPVTTK